MNDQPSPSAFAVPPEPKIDLKMLENSLKSAYRMASITKSLLEHNLTTPQTNSFTDYNSFVLQFDQAEDILFSSRSTLQLLENVLREWEDLEKD